MQENESVEEHCIPTPFLDYAKVTPNSGQKIPIESSETQLKWINNKPGRS